MKYASGAPAAVHGSQQYRSEGQLLQLTEVDHAEEHRQGLNTWQASTSCEATQDMLWSRPVAHVVVVAPCHHSFSTF